MGEEKELVKDLNKHIKGLRYIIWDLQSLYKWNADDRDNILDCINNIDKKIKNLRKASKV